MPPDWQARPLQKTRTVPTWCARHATSVTLVHAVHNGNIICTKLLHGTHGHGGRL